MLRGLRSAKWAAQWLAATGSPAWALALARRRVPPVHRVAAGPGGELQLGGAGFALPPSAREGGLLEAFDDLAALARAGAGYRAGTPWDTLTVDGVDLHVHGAQSVRIAAEVFLHGIYAVRLPRVPVVVDVGMNVGTASLYLAKTLGAVVHGYEPFAETFERAQENVRANPALAPRIHAHRAAVGGTARPGRFVFCPDSPGDCGAVPIPEEYRRGRPVREEEVEIVSIVDVLREVAPAGPGGVLLKIDCEGMEYEIVEALQYDARALASVDAVMVEWHRRAAQGSPKRLAHRLEEMGFAVFGRTAGEGDAGMLHAARLAP